MSVEDLVRVDRGVPATALPPAVALPHADVNRPLLDSDAAKGWTQAAGAAFPARPPLATVLARTRLERTGWLLTDWLFATGEKGWLCDCSGGKLSLP
jgi:hypothetical protein